jgi:hypothetical protein
VSKNRDAFLVKFRAAAEAIEKETGIPAARILAQAGHETGWNINAPGNNFFGIKAQPGYSGSHQTLDTQEDYGHGLQNVKQRFRAYEKPEDSFRDWSKLLQQDNFKSALDPNLDDAGFASALAKGGYATDPNYASKLSNVIAGTRTALGQPAGATVLASVPPQHVGAGAASNPVMAQDEGAAENARLMQVGDTAAQAAVNSQPAAGAPAGLAGAGSLLSSLNGLTRTGQALSASAEPKAQPFQPLAPSPVYRPQQQNASLLDVVFPGRRNPFFG